MNARILVIDDENGVLLFVRRLLERKGYAVDCCETPEAALAAATCAPYDLLLCDKNLPGLTGMELIRRIRALQPSVPAILMTGFPEMLDPSVKVQGYLAKPFDNLAQVVEAVERALAFGVLMQRSAGAQSHAAK